MKTIKASNDGIFPLLTKRDAGFVQAAYAEKLSEMDPARAEKELLKIINRAFAELQRFPPGLSGNERERFLLSFVKWIKLDCEQYFPNVTIVEVSTAVARGIRKEYGQTYGFNTIIVHGFIQAYLESEERTGALAKQHRYLLLLEVADVLPMDDKWSIMKNGILLCYENYRKTRRILDFGGVNFEIWEKAGAINLSLDEKHLIYEVARMQVMKEQEMQSTSYRMVCQLRRQNETSDWPVKVKAREIALKNFFDTAPDIESWMDKLYEAFKIMEPDKP